LGLPGHEKEREIFYPVAKKERLRVARSKTVTKNGTKETFEDSRAECFTCGIPLQSAEQ